MLSELTNTPDTSADSQTAFSLSIMYLTEWQFYNNDLFDYHFILILCLVIIWWSSVLKVYDILHVCELQELEQSCDVFHAVEIVVF